MIDYTIKLTKAQRSALECRADGGLDEVTERCWKGRTLEFYEHEAAELWMELIEAANAEDAQATQNNDAAARGASLALSNLATKVSRSNTHV